MQLDPPVVSERSWDALDDSLWEGLWQLSEREIDIYWPDASGYEASSPHDYRIAIQILDSVADTLAEARFTVGMPKDVRVYLS